MTRLLVDCAFAVLVDLARYAVVQLLGQRVLVPMFGIVVALTATGTAACHPWRAASTAQHCTPASLSTRTAVAASTWRTRSTAGQPARLATRHTAPQAASTRAARHATAHSSARAWDAAAGSTCRHTTTRKAASASARAEPGDTTARQPRSGTWPAHRRVRTRAWCSTRKPARSGRVRCG